jgi:hypothetical protein
MIRSYICSEKKEKIVITYLGTGEKLDGFRLINLDLF